MNHPLHAAEKVVRVLLVEDNPGDAELTREALAAAKIRIEITVAETAHHALDILRGVGPHAWAPLPDLILLDINLPGISGIELLAILKEDKGLKRIPIIMLTSSGDEHEILTCYELGANCFLSKPIGFDGFRELVSSMEGFWFSLVRLPASSAPSEGTAT